MLHSPFLLLHILAMFSIVAFHSGPQFLALAAARMGQTGALGPIADLYARTGRLVPPLGILGALAGLATALTGEFNLLAPWLLIAYGLFVVIIVYGGLISAPYVLRLGEAAREGRPNLEQLLGRRLTLIVAGDASLLVLIIADMVLKPFA
jgi:hypothetical protein